MAKFKLNQELNNVKKETMVSDFKSKKVFFSIPSNILNLIDSRLSDLPNPLEVALKKIDKNTRRLKLLPISLGNKNEDYPDFFCDLPIRVFKKINISFFGGSFSDDLWKRIYEKKKKTKYLNQAAGRSNTRRPRRPPAGNVIEEIEQPLGFVHQMNDLMKRLIKKLLTKKNLTAFVVALAAILILRYIYIRYNLHVDKARKENKEEEPKKHITKCIIKFIINIYNYLCIKFKDAYVQSKIMVSNLLKVIKHMLNKFKVVSQRLWNTLLKISKYMFNNLFKISQYLLNKIYNSLTVKFLKITFLVLFFITIVFSILMCVFFLIGIKNIRLPVTS